MTHDEWIGAVKLTLYRHPDWLADTQAAIMRGLQERIDDEAQLRVNAETALIMAYDAGKAHMTEVNRQTVEVAIMRSAVVAGTPFVKALEAQHRKQAQETTT